MRKVVNLSESPGAATIFYQFFLSLTIILGSTFLVSILGLALAAFYTGLPLKEFQNTDWIHANDKLIQGFKVIQVFSQLGMFVIPALLIPLLLYKVRADRFLGLNRQSGFILYSLAFLAFFTLTPLIAFCIDINQHMHFSGSFQWLQDWLQQKQDSNDTLTLRFISMHSFSSFLANVLIVAIVPAFAEEIFFRGFIQRTLYMWFRQKHLAVIITAAFFSFIHMQFFGFLPRFALGLLLGYIFLWSGNIKLSMFVHFLNNFTELLSAYLDQRAGKVVDINANPQFPPVIYILSAVAGGLLLYAFYRNSKSRRPKEEDGTDTLLNSDEPWEKIYTTPDSYQAEIIAGSLKAEGIRAVVVNKKDSSYRVFGEAEVYVPQKDVKRAMEILPS